MGSDAELWLTYKTDPSQMPNLLESREIGRGRKKRFAVLSNLHGQKYTVGATYTSREVQGEFILLPPEVRNQRSFAINVENDKYFLVPGPRTTSIFVNGDQLLVEEKRELTFGDKFWLGNEEHAFIFQKREYNQKAVTKAKVKERNTEIDTGFNYNRSGLPRFTNAKADFAPGQNGLIVSKIMSYLPVKDIKKCRFLSKLWNDEARKILGKRCTIFLNFSSNYKHPDESMKLFRYSVEMADLPLQNLTIEQPIVLEFRGEPKFVAMMSALNMMDLKLVDDLSSFLESSKARSTTKLKIMGDIDYQLGLKILATLSPTLVELNLSWSEKWKSVNSPDPFPTNIKFQKLTTVILSNWWPQQKNNSNLSLLNGLIPAISGVSSIQLKKCEAELCTAFLSKMSTSSFLNLNKLSSLLVTPDTIQSLLKGHQAMKTLEFGELKDMKPGDYLAFEELLKKHAATLESLEFVICPMIVQNPAGQVIEIKLPSLPKLRHLSIGLSHEFAKVSPPGLMLNFPGGGINYEEDFPTLQSLTLWPLGGNNKNNYVLNGSTMIARVCKQIVSFYAMFFPGIGPDFGGQPQIVESVLELDILIRGSNQEYKRRQLLSESAVTRITAMFPNLMDKDWAKEEYGVNDEDNPVVHVGYSYVFADQGNQDSDDDSDEDNQDSDEDNQDSDEDNQDSDDDSDEDNQDSDEDNQGSDKDDEDSD